MLYHIVMFMPLKLLYSSCVNAHVAMVVIVVNVVVDVGQVVKLLVVKWLVVTLLVVKLLVVKLLVNKSMHNHIKLRAYALGVYTLLKLRVYALGAYALLKLKAYALELMLN